MRKSKKVRIILMRLSISKEKKRRFNFKLLSHPVNIKVTEAISGLGATYEQEIKMRKYE